MATNSQIGKFELILEHDASDGYQYKPGEWLRGEIILEVVGSRPLEANSISVELRGEGQVSWQQQDDDDNDDRDLDENKEDTDGGLVDVQREDRARPLTKTNHLLSPPQRSLNDRYFNNAAKTRYSSQQPSVPNGGEIHIFAVNPLSSTRASHPLRSGVHRRLCTSVETYVDESRTVWTSYSSASTAAELPLEVNPTTSNSHERGSVVHDSSSAVLPGKHLYRFAFLLPVDIPSSFRGQYGSVGYAARAIVMMSTSSLGRHRLAGGRVAVVSRPFFVKRPHVPSLIPVTKQQKLVDGTHATTAALRQQRWRRLRSTNGSSSSANSFSETAELNVHRSSSSAAAVVVVEISKHSPSLTLSTIAFCCPGASLSGRARAEFVIRDGTVCRLGGYFSVDIRVSDVIKRRRLVRSSSILKAVSVEAALVQQCVFTTYQGMRRRTVALVSRRTDLGGGDESHSSRLWTDLRLSVPTNLPESGLPGCSLIDVSYELRFSVQVSGRHKLKARLPVTVHGTLITDDVSPTPTASLTDVVMAANNVSGNREVRVIVESDRPDTTVGESGQPTSSRVLNDKDLSEVVGKFRRPMVPGEIRQNLIYDAVIEEQE